MDINRLDIQILRELKNNKALEPVSALSIDEINNKNMCSRVHFNRRIVWLLKEGLITKGYKDRMANTYYISDKGLKVIQNAQ